MAETMKTIDTVDPRPFKKLIMTIGELPTSFLESMTYYEMLAWFVDYLQNTIIPSVNNNAEALRELQSAFVTLKNYVDNYFANLDVQEEINNKLDAMAKDGTLTQLIAQFLSLNAVMTFPSVANMKLAQNLVDGSTCETYGFYSANDGGGAKYLVRKITNQDTVDEKTLFALFDPNLVAELILKETMNIKQFGAKPNDENFNNQPYIQTAFDTKKNIVIGDNVEDVYWVYSASRFYNNVTFNSWLKNKGSLGQANDRIIYIENEWSDKIITVKNPLIDGNRDITKSFDANDHDEFGHGINIRSSRNIKIDGGTIIKCQGDGITVGTTEDVGADHYYSENVEINNVTIDYAYRNCISVISGVNVTIKDCTTYNRNGFRDILVEPNQDDTLRNKNIVIDGGYHYGNSGAGVIEFNSNRAIDGVTIKNTTIENDTGSTCPIRTVGSTYRTNNIIIDNNNIINHRNNGQILINICTGDVTFINNIITGNESLGYNAFASFTGNVIFNNNIVDLKDGDTLKAFVGVYKGVQSVVLNDNTFYCTNTTSAYSGQVNIYEAKVIQLNNNSFLNTQNAISIGEQSNASATHAYAAKAVYMIDNYVKAFSEYPTSRALVIQPTIDVDTLYINYNFYDGITNKIVIKDNTTVTNKYGDIFE